MKLVFKELFKDRMSTVLYWFELVIELIEVIINIIVVKLVADIFGPGSFVNKLTMFIVISAIEIALSAIIGYTKFLYSSRIEKVGMDRYSAKILGADVEMFTKVSCAKVYSALSFISSITTVTKIVRWTIINLFEVLGIFVAIFIIGGWKIALSMIVIYAIAAVCFKFIYKKLNSYDEEKYKLRREWNQSIDNVVNGFAEVRSFNMVEYFKAKISNNTQERYELMKRRAETFSRFYSIITIIERLAMVVSMIYAGSLMSKGTIDATVAIAIVLYTQRILNPLIGVFDNVDGLSDAMSSKEDYEKIINWVNKYKDEGTVELKDFSKCIALTNVTFKYEEENVLNNLSLRVQKGKRVGICGKSGEGKTTIFNMLNRFYEPDFGMISIDGYDVKEINKESYYNLIGCVFQDNNIFPGTIRDNLLFGNMAADDNELLEALDKANFRKFVEELPEGLETDVGPKGLKLSGGQKQRIALARLFLKDPEIILLDEATSALDNESEHIVKEAIDRLQGKTVITIAHRLSTIRDCDEIFVIENGGVIEHGDHNTLLKMGGEYAKMLTMPTLEKF